MASRAGRNEAPGELLAKFALEPSAWKALDSEPTGALLPFGGVVETAAGWRADEPWVRRRPT
jgi:hypothetical protein